VLRQKRKLVDSEDSGMVIDLTMDSESPRPSGTVDGISIRGSSPLAYGSEGEEEEVCTHNMIETLRT
jgi:hypothetical protein